MQKQKQIEKTQNNNIEEIVNDMLFKAASIEDVRAIVEKIMERAWTPQYVKVMSIMLECCIAYLIVYFTHNRENRNLTSVWRLVRVMEKDDPDGQPIFAPLMDEVRRDAGRDEALRMYLLYNYVQTQEFAPIVYQNCQICLERLLVSCLTEIPYKEEELWEKLDDITDAKESDEDAEETDGSDRLTMGDLLLHDKDIPFVFTPQRVGGWDASPVHIKRLLDKTVLGQDDAKKMLSVTLFQHVRAWRSGAPGGGHNVMLIGNTGSGKTLLATELAKISGLPYTIIDGASLSKDGWHGLNRDDVLRSYYLTNAVRGRDAEYGIIIIDEFDKLVSQGYSSKGDNVGAVTQSIFLTLLEGVPVMDSARKGLSMKTENLMFIFTGAFTKIDEKKKAERKTIGFVPGAPQQDDHAFDTIREDIMEAGVIPELAGRLGTIVKIQELSLDEAVKAIITSPYSVIKRHARELAADGMLLDVSRDYVRGVAEKMLKLKLGVRGCNNMLEDEIKKATYAAYEAGDKKVRIGYPETRKESGQRKLKPKPKQNTR